MYGKVFCIADKHQTLLFNFISLMYLHFSNYISLDISEGLAHIFLRKLAVLVYYS